METIYTPPSHFAGGFSKAMECVKVMALEAVNTGFGTVKDQDYKWANVIIDEETGDVMDLKKLLKHPKYTETWRRAASDEYGRLFQGKNACHWIKRNQVPKDKIATYNRSVADIRPEKAEPKQVQFTAGGNILKYTGETSTETVLVETENLIINSTLLT